MQPDQLREQPAYDRTAEAVAKTLAPGCLPYARAPSSHAPAGRLQTLQVAAAVPTKMLPPIMPLKASTKLPVTGADVSRPVMGRAPAAEPINRPPPAPVAAANGGVVVPDERAVAYEPPEATPRLFSPEATPRKGAPDDAPQPRLLSQVQFVKDGKVDEGGNKVKPTPSGHEMSSHRAFSVPKLEVSSVLKHSPRESEAVTSTFTAHERAQMMKRQAAEAWPHTYDANRTMSLIFRWKGTMLPHVLGGELLFYSTSLHLALLLINIFSHEVRRSGIRGRRVGGRRDGIHSKASTGITVVRPRVTTQDHFDEFGDRLNVHECTWRGGPDCNGLPEMPQHCVTPLLSLATFFIVFYVQVTGM